jgi:hypothetical protein
MPDCIVSRIVEKKSNDYMILYQVIKTPWPLNSRDFTFETRIIKDKEKIIELLKLFRIHPILRQGITSE